MRQIRLVVEYDGTALCGWQRQANAPTVQQHLEEAASKLFDHDVKIAGASRTDAGVHARGQVACLRTQKTIPLHGIRRGLNSLLPETIAINRVEEVPDEFHPRFSATGKHYRYTLFTRADRSPRWRNRAWHHPDPLDLEAMQRGAAALIGEHDFSAFRAAGCTARTATRQVERIELTAGEADIVRVDVHGNAFLRNMVRIIVGTLTEVGTGHRPAGQLAEILASRDRTQAGITAPAHGLELMEVR
ncbi:MAG: tRNA pseudouridine(38-40) synthase TruA, partial [Kofleriaceae bacterium]